MSGPADPTQGLSPGEKRELLRELLRRDAGAAVVPVSAGQRALWFMHQLDPASAAYNVISRWRVRSRVNVAALRAAFQRLVDRHDVLRTTFEVTAQGEPVQRVHDRQPVSFSAMAAAGWSDAEIDDRLHRAASVPFDLARGPVCRAELFTRGVDEHVLLLTCHHIAYDHWSLSRLMADWMALYEAEVARAPGGARADVCDLRGLRALAERHAVVGARRPTAGVLGPDAVGRASPCWTCRPTGRGRWRRPSPGARISARLTPRSSTASHDSPGRQASRRTW